MSTNQNIAEALSGISGAVLPSLSTNTRPRTRVWRACEVCRKRKIKCDGQDPCHFCSTNKKQCTCPYVLFVLCLVLISTVTEIADHASGTRQITSNFENRLVQLEQIVMPMAKVFEDWAKANVPNLRPASTGFKHSKAGPSQLPPISADPPSPSEPSSSSKAFSPTRQPRSPYMPSVSIHSMLNPDPASPTSQLHEPTMNTSPADLEEQLSDRFSHLTKDSLGNLRFIGGASSLVLVEALQSLRDSQTPDTSPDSFHSEAAINKSPENLDLPFFRKNVHFRRFDVLPPPEDTVFPSADVADRLVAVYFERIHHTFPILNQKAFLKRYTEVMRGVHSGTPSNDHAFLSSLFAVLACAQSLSVGRPSSPTDETRWKWTVPTEYAGLEFYERSMILFWMGSRFISIENVQCLALLAICCAGWNTLSHSWLLAGQAIRAAQDLGLHRSPRRLSLNSVEKEQRRRIWWCVYGLDRVLSISLGRPGGTDDDDSDVEFPVEVDDEDLESYFSGKLKASEVSYMCGFVALLKIYIVAGKIVRSAHSLKLLKEINETGAQVPTVIHHLDIMLEDWVESLPPNMMTLCLIAFFVYYSATINLHRPFIPNPRDSYASTSSEASLTKCVSAARACIRIGDMVQTTLPASHHLAYAVQQVCLSGVILLRVVTRVTDAALVTAILADAEKCASILEGLQEVWSGAKRCKEIVNELLVVVKARWARVKDFFIIPAESHSPPSSTRKRKADEDDHDAQSKQARIRVHEPSAEGGSAAVSLLAAYDMPGGGNGMPDELDIDMSILDSGAVQQQFSGYDFLGNDLEAILGHVMAENIVQEDIYDAQMLWNAWEREGR
ncbi:fungal-specific transcription factor domain-containing protein [Mucidula mucida]|nr:fungal-specific transcription factor domain-containing protein [Mucidula mucida]